MKGYHILLDTKDQLFTSVSNHNSNVFGNGRTIQEAVENLKNLEKV